MKTGLLVCLILSTLVPVAIWSITTPDMREVKTYESYCDANGDIQNKELPNQMYSSEGGKFSQYWRFHGIKYGILTWLQYAAFSFVALFLSVILTIRLSRSEQLSI